MNRGRFRRLWVSTMRLGMLLVMLVLVVVSAEFFAPGDVPGPPDKVFVSPASDTSIRVQFSKPLNVKPEGVNGAPVFGYKVEVARRIDEVQMFSVVANGPILAGSYKATFTNRLGTEVTSCIAWNASDVELETALEQLPNVDSVAVSRSFYSAAKNGFVYTITFDGAYLVSGQQSNLLMGSTTGCQATRPPSHVLSFEGALVTTGVSGFYPEVWEIISTDSSDMKVLGGTFDLSIGFEGDWVDTNPGITADVAPGTRTVKTSASMLGRVNRGDRVRIKGEEFTVHATAPFTDSELPLDSYHIRGAADAAIELMDTALGNVQVTKTSNLITTSSDFSLKIAVDEEIQIGAKVFKVTNIATNSMTLDAIWTGDTTLHITAFARKKTTVSVNVEANEMKRALGALPGAGSIDVSRIGPTRTNGYRWYVTFQSLDNVNLRVDKQPGTMNFVDVYGAVCSTCTVTASVIRDETFVTTLTGIQGDYAANAIVASQEVSGVINEVQTISTTATADDISGSFAVSFQSVGGAMINFDDTAADVRTKLQNLATVGRLHVTRRANDDFGATWTITFMSNLGDLPLFVVDDDSLLKGTGVNVKILEVVQGVDVAFETIIQGLDPGQEYYVRAFARNENGYSTSTTDLQQIGRGALPLLTAVSTSPDPPSVNGMWPLSGSQLELRLSSPVDHGDPVSKYLIEYAVGESFGKVATKRVFVFSSLENDVTGTFRLQYGDDVTSLLSVHTTASALQRAFNSLPSVRPVSVTRALYVVVDGSGTSLSAAHNHVTMAPLTALQCEMLTKGERIDVGGKRFIVRVQPAEGSTTIDVEPGHGVQDFTANAGVLKLDDSGTQHGPYGYEWTISFDNDVGDIIDRKYPGLQFISSLTSVTTSAALASTTFGIKTGQTAVSANHYGFFEVNSDEQVCDTYVVGAPSSVQVVRLFAPTTATGGTFKLQLGSETTDCITLGNIDTPSTMKAKLEALELVSKVTVEEVRAFKVAVLSGSATSKVTDYDNTGELSVASPFTSLETGVLVENTIIQVSRNPNDFSRHSCEFIINTTPATGTTKISVTVVGSCEFFSNEARSLKILDFHDYQVRFWGQYPTRQWPTLQFDLSEFGAGICDPWTPANLPVYGQVHTIKYEGACFKEQVRIQTILADALRIIGGSFTLSYMGKVTLPLSFQYTGAAEMRDAIESITTSATVRVSVSQYGVYGKAWHVTFTQEQEDAQDAIFIQHSRLTGQNAVISVYPTVTVFTDAKQDDISGSFRLTISGETTEAIGYSATHMKVVQELQKLTIADSVVALGDKTDDVGVYSLELTADATGGSKILTNIQLDGILIDPTRFLAIGEMLEIGSNPSHTIQSMSCTDVTLTSAFPGTTASQNYKVLAGLITKQTKILPGYVGIHHLGQVIAVTKGQSDFVFPVDHGFSVNNVFFIDTIKFTITAVSGVEVTTDIPYTGENVVAGAPSVYIFDNTLRTTEDLTNLVDIGDDLWLPSVSADMKKYSVIAVDPRYIEVTGSFTETITRTRASHVSNGRKWDLVFRSYDGNLDTIDVIPDHDWRGTDARIGIRSPKSLSKNVVNVGNPASTQTILLEVNDVAIATPYTLSFAGETVVNAGSTTVTNLPWATLNDDLKDALETLDSVDGVSVVSTVNGGTVVHTISFWGTYPMKKLPLLVVTPATANLQASVQGNNAVAVTKQETLILDRSQAYAFRIFAQNSRGLSDSVTFFQTETTVTSVVPTPPTGVALGEFHGPTWLSLNYWAPYYSGGAKVTMYRVEWDSSPNFESSSRDYGVATIQETVEVQEVTTSYRSAVGVGGTFTLAWGGRKTSALPFDCSVEDMTDALVIITETSNVAVDPVKVTRTPVSWGYTWKITFLHNHGDLAPLVADGRQLTGDFPRIRVLERVPGFSDLATGDFTHEVQEIYTDGVSPVAGSFALTFHGKTTGLIDVGASALEMQAALQATSSSYSIKVTKAVRNAALHTAIWSVTFAYLRGEEMVGAGNIFTMTVAASQVTGTSSIVRVANKVTGSDPFRFALPGLRSGVKYYAHVMAYNADGFGSATSPLASAVTCVQPPPPPSVTATVVDKTTLAVAWSASAVGGQACSVDKYKVEWYRAEGMQEQQTITTSAGAGLPEIERLANFDASGKLNGYFKLSFGGEVTENIRWDAAAVGLNSVKERLERLSTIGTVHVSRTDSTRVVGGLLVTVTSNIATVHTSSSSSIDDSKLKKDDILWIAGERRTISAVVAAGATTFELDGNLDVSVPTPVFKSAYGYEWEITFLAGHVGPQELLQVSPSDSWTGDHPGIVVDSVQKGLQPISGTFRVAFASHGLSDTTPPMPHNISALQMQTVLESLVTIGAVAVTRRANGYGFSWVITFLSEVKEDISLLSVDGTELQGPGARILAARTLAGVQPLMYCERNGVAGVAADVAVPGQLRYVLQGLKTGEKYAVRVRAHNSEGYGKATSLASGFQTPRSTALAPERVELIALSSKLLKATWQVPTSDGGARITSYEVQWDTSASFASPSSGILHVAPSDDAPFYLNIPVPSVTRYFVRICAVNNQGKGEFGTSSPSSLTPLDRPPGRPEAATATVLSSYAILVEWKPSSTEKDDYGGDGGLPISQYMVEWDHSRAFDSPAAFALVDGAKRSYVIGGDDAVTGVRSEELDAGSTYSVRVTAFNAKGASAPRPTTPSSVTMMDQTPSAPQRFQLTGRTATSVTADWTNPLYDGGASLQSYKIEWDEQEDFTSGQRSSGTVPIVREMQAIVLQNDVVNEEQFVDVTVKVTNEEQVVRTSFTGVDEVQVIKTTNNVVVDEVQTIVTSATDRNEVQELRLDGDDVDEIQAVRTSVPEVLEVQTLTVGVARVSEIQTISLTLPGAFASPSTVIGGTLYFSFDSSICTHCVKKMYQRTDNLVPSLKDDVAGETIAENALIALANIDAVQVTRSKNNAGPDLTYVYTITFTGLEVAGNVPVIAIDAAVTVSGAAVPGLPTQATEATPGSEVAYDPLAIFTVTYTCESYSDPYALTTFSLPCTPHAAARLCAGCVTAFDGVTFAVAYDLRSSAYVASGAKLLAGVCSFEAGLVTKTASSTTIDVAVNDVGVYCSQFLGKSLDLYETPQISRDIPLKTTATTIASGSVVGGLLTGAIDAVTVARAEAVDGTFVGSVYTLTFRKRSGTLPLLACTAAGSVSCTVGRTAGQVGSMITGTFQLGLVSEADATLVSPSPQYTSDIPWDASESDLKRILEDVTQNAKKVFGTVAIKRTVSSPTGNKWSGGFTWQITFTSRGGDIPRMVARTVDAVTNVKTLTSTHDPTNAIPTVSVEDATHPFNPFAHSRDGNQVMGSIMLKLGDVASPVSCTIGVDTSLDALDLRVRDTTLETFLKTNLKIPSLEIMRSAATQARGFTWTISFSDASTGGDIGLLQTVSTQLTGKNVRSGVYETVKGNELGGTFQLTFNGETTEPIGFAAEASEMQTKLNKLNTIKPSSVLVTRGPPTSPQVRGYTWFVTFYSSVWADPTSDHSNGVLGNWKSSSRASWEDVWESGYSKAWGRHVGHTFRLQCLTDGLSTSANDGSQRCVPSVFITGVGPLRGTFTISIDSTAATYAHMAVNSVVTSTAIAHNAWASKEESGNTGTSVEEILESMANVGDVAVSRSSVDVKTGGYEWTVTFLRDASHAFLPCEQLEEVAGSLLCNAPGDVPLLGFDTTLLTGANSVLTTTLIKEGAILRGDFTDFRVQGDAGMAARYTMSASCSNAAGTSCTVAAFAIKSGADTLDDFLVPGDRFTVGTFSSCIFDVTSVTATSVEIKTTGTANICATMNAGNAGAATALGISLRLPWNADERMVARALEAGATHAGRKVHVKRTVHGKYGEMSWLVRFIANPTYTPPGAGELPDITTLFAAESGSSKYQVTVTQVTPGSKGLSGSFLLDFHASSYGPREILFDEEPDRLQRKLNEMNTVGHVTVKRFKYPSSSTGCDDALCSGGWEEQPVLKPGTRGGYRWRIRFMQATGDYEGSTFPPGSGDVASLSATRSSLQGTSVSVDVYTNIDGSSPTRGTFTLNTTEKQTPVLPYASSAEAVKLGIEAMDLFGHVDVTHGFLLTQKIPGATATLAQDGVTATITGVDDIRQYLAPTDRIRFGATSASNLAGTNGDAPLTGVIDTSRVMTSARSPIVTATTVSSTKMLFPGMQLRIDGLNYHVQRSGHEVQTLTVTRPLATWSSTYIADSFKLEMTRGGLTKPPTTCLRFNEDATTVQAAVFSLLFAFDSSAKSEDVVVSRVGPMTTATRKGYVYSVYFFGDSVAGDVATLKALDCAGIETTTVDIEVVTHGGKVPHQRLTLATDAGTVEDATGFYKLGLGTKESDCIPWGASASEVETVLEDTLLTGDVVVTRSGTGTSQTELQRLRLTANTQVTSTVGLFQVQFTFNGQICATSCLKYGLSAVDLEAALNGFANVNTLNSIHHINVTRVGDGQAQWGYGYEYLIQFQGPITGGFSAVLGDVPQLQVGNVGTGACAAGALAGIYPALRMETVQQGAAGYTYDIFFLDYKPTPFVPALTLKQADIASENVCLIGWKSKGGSVRKVAVDMVELGGSSEVQILTITDRTATGAFTLTFRGGVESNCLLFTAQASEIAQELVTLTSSVAGDVLVATDTNILESPEGFHHRITFVGEAVTGNVPLIGVVQKNNAACGATVPATNVMVATAVDGGEATGEFALTSAYDGEAPDTPHILYTVSQQFRVLDEQFEVLQLVISNPSQNIASGATYTLTVLGTNTNPIPWDASETALQTELTRTAQTALNPLSVGASDVVVTRRTTADLAPHGFVYTIYFAGTSVAGNLATVGANQKTIEVVTATAPNIGPTHVIVSTIRQGVDGVATLTASSIPLALEDDLSTASRYLSSTAQQKLEVFKVNGFIWTIKFKSALGNVPKLGRQTTALVGGTMNVIDDFVPGSASNAYVLSNLRPGIKYFAHGAAWSDIGIGTFTSPASIVPSSTASGVQNVASGPALYEREVQQIRLAASHVMEIQEIRTEAARVAEVQTLRTFVLPSACPGGNCLQGRFAFRVPTVQTVTISAAAAITSGTFTLLFTRDVAADAPNQGTFKTLGAKTGAIAWDADAVTIQTALTSVVGGALATDDVVVTRDGDASEDYDYGYVFQITFVGNDVAGETKRLVCDDKTFVATGGVAVNCDVAMNTDTAMGTDTAVQQVLVTATEPVAVGSYKLHFNHLGMDKVSACIPFDASASTMETILEAMPNIDNVYVARETDADKAPNGFVYRIFFHGNGVYGDTPSLVWLATDTGCTAFQTIDKNALTAVDGKVETTVLDAGGFNAANTFVDVASATAAQLTAELNRLPVFGDVLVSQSIVDEQGGYMWTVAFQDSYGNLPQFICAVDPATFSPVAHAGCETNTLTDGNVLTGSFLIESSSPIPFDANAERVKAALETIAWVGTVQVKQSEPSPQFGYTWTITFLDYNGDVPTLRVTSSLVGTESQISVQEVRKGNAVGGTFTLSYQNVVTASIDWNAVDTAVKSSADGSSMQEKLEALDVIGRVNVERVGPDQEGGYSWTVTFLDNILNSGDLPLLQGNASDLTGEGAVVFTKEVTKGSNAVGDQLWLSFDPPATDNGSPITKYQVRWDTSSSFTANPADVMISDADILYRTQCIMTSASSLAWSKNKLQVTPSDVQKLTILTDGTFTLKFRGVETVTLTAVAAGTTAGATTMAGLEAALEALSSVGSIDISAVTAATVLAVNAEFQLTFTTLPGALPLIKSSDISVASVVGIQTGATNFRKEVVVFTCTASQGTVRFTFNGEYTDVAFNAALTDVETSLFDLFGVEAESISVSSAAQSVLCKTATSSEIKIVFDRVYADINLSITKGVDVGADAAIVLNTDASIDGVYNDDHALTMSGTFQVGYHGQYTRPLNAESSADQLRYALEDLDTIQTVGVVREKSFQALPGKVDVTEGEIFVTCSAGETCTFESAAYGLPGYEIRIGGDWYTVRTDLNSPGLHPARLYLGDLNGREVGYRGATQTGIAVYEWTKGYVWTVDLLSVTSPLSYMNTKVPRLYPIDAIVEIAGRSCAKCYYLATQTSKKLTMGQEYYIEVHAYNTNGKGAAPVDGFVTATPSQVPAAPSNVNLAVVSGQELEVFFSPPLLGTTNVSPDFNKDISSYLVQWDVVSTFKHGRQICASCATQLNGDVLSISMDLSNLLTHHSKFTVATDSCVLTADVVGLTSIQLVSAHGCASFNGQNYPLYYYTYPVKILSGAVIQGSPPFRYVIPSLTAGKTYYVRVAAVNSVPVQQVAMGGEPPDNRKWSYPLSATTADRVPDPPLSVLFNPFSSATLEMQIQPSTRDGKGTSGTGISAFWIDVDTVSTFDSARRSVPVEVAVNSGSIPELFVGGPRIYYVTGLTAGTRYYAQVKTVNSIGYSRATIASTSQTPTRHPTGPATVKASTLTVAATPITSATVTWQQPADNGGVAVSGYKVEWWRSASRPEIQTVELKWTVKPTSSPFKLSFGGLTTAALPMDISAADLRFALMSLASATNVPLGHIQVSRTAVNIVHGYQWSITFDNTNVNAGDQPLLQYEQDTITGGSDVTGRTFEVQSGIAVPATNTFPGKQEVQVLVTYHATLTMSGYFRLSYKGSAWTNYLSATVSAADLKLALEALPTIGVVSVKSETMLLSGSAWFGDVWTITFESTVGNLMPLVVDASRIIPTEAVVLIKDGDNAVDTTGLGCLPDGTSGCPGLWPSVLKNLKQQAGAMQTIDQLSTVGEAAVEYGYYETLDASTTTWSIPGLTPGNSYLISVSARNPQGLGPRTQSSPVVITPPLQVPGPPVNVSVDVNPGVSTQLVASWAAPASDGGSPIWMYRVEYDASSLFTDRGQEDQWCPNAPTPTVWLVQTVRTSAVSTDPIASGSFKLELTRKNIVEVSDPIPWNAVAGASEEAGSVTASSSGVFCTSASTVCTTEQLEKSGSMQLKLTHLSQLNSGVEVTRSTMATSGGFTWTITFLDGGDDFSLAARDVNLACTGVGCTGTYDVVPTRVRAGVKPSTCTGSHVLPTSGALNKGQLYYVRVFAYNQVGFGEPKLAAAPQKPMVAPGAPTGVTLAVLTVSELVVLFNPPDEDGGDTVTGYEVQYATDSGFTSPSSVLVQLTTGMSAPYRRIISSLTKGTRYYVRVRARNSQGFGQYQVSSPPSQQPYTRPSSPTRVVLGVTSATMLTVGWAPPLDDGGDPVSGYIVQWDVVSTFDSLAVAASTTAVINDVTQRSYTITLLTPGTRYYVRVFATNLGGKGTPQTSSPASMVPATTRPGKPTSLIVTATATTGQLQVVWQPPRVPAHGIPCAGTVQAPQSCPILNGLDMVSGGVSLESYLVQSAASSDFSLATEVSVTSTSAIISGLESGKPYYVRVLTVNSQGLNSDFCVRANSQNLLCPDHVVLEDGSVVTGNFVFAVPK